MGALDGMQIDGGDVDVEEDKGGHDPGCKTSGVVLKPQGAKTRFRPVSELEAELLSMNAVRF